MKRVKVGIIGCGAISPAYLSNLITHFAPMVDVAAVSDLDLDAAHSRAVEYRVPKACSTAELLADPEIEMVVNLTFAHDHHAVTMAALRAGKHVFTEKPLAVERAEGQEILDTANRNGLLVAGAADTFLGGGLQTCRELLDAGAIGTPLMACGFIALNYGNAARWQRRGTGPIFDMGPYYLTALVALQGPVKRVTGGTSIPIPQKSHPVGSPDYGQTFTVETPMEAAGILEFASGMLGVFAASGEAAEGYVPRLEFYGTTGTLQANDPNMYAGEVKIRGGQGREVLLERGFIEKGRGLGVAELAWAVRSGRQPRAGGQLMVHVLDIMHAIHEAAETGRRGTLQSTVERPALFDWNEIQEAFSEKRREG